MLVAVVCACGTYWARVRDSTARFLCYGYYGNAILRYIDRHGVLPQSVGELEADWNAYENHRQSLPPAGYDHPIYRPPESLIGGPYLILVEPKPWRWYAKDVVAIYVSPDGRSVDYQRVRPSAVRRLITEDDARRARARLQQQDARTQPHSRSGSYATTRGTSTGGSAYAAGTDGRE